MAIICAAFHLVRIETDDQPIGVAASAASASKISAKLDKFIGQRVGNCAAHTKVNFLAAGSGHEIGLRFVGDQLAAIQNGDLVAQRLGLFQIMRCQDDGDTSRVQGPDIIPQLLAQRDIDTCRWLVQYQNGR